MTCLNARRFWARVLGSALLVTASSACSPDRPSPLEPQQPNVAHAVLSARPDSIYNRYVVLFGSDVADPLALASELVALHGGYIFHFYQRAVKGFAVANLPAGVAEVLRALPTIKSVEVDGLAQQNDDQFLPLDGGSFQASSLWSLDRMDERQAVFDGVFRYTPGTGTHIYILDTGIRCGHNEFAGRIGNGTTQLSFSSGASPCIDQDGHGTAVASVAAGTTYGVAKGATLHPVRINDNGDAYDSDIIAGLDWVANNAIHPAVANLSYGAVPWSFSVRDAVEGLINSGVAMTKSAGNSNFDAFEDRVNRANGAIIASATDRVGQRANFASGLAAYGPTVTVWAPGYEIRAASNNDNSSFVIVYGTSFSAPYSAGVAASFLQTEPSASAFRVRDVIRESATQDVLTNLGAGSANRLLYSRFRSAMINGPIFILSDATATYTWNAVTSGGTFSGYQWDISINGGAFTPVSSSNSYSRTIFTSDSYSFVLRLTATGDGESVSSTSTVTVSPPAPQCEPTPPALTC